jgi:N-formylglutamate deformylase
VEPLFALSARQRLQEEDPFTDLWTGQDSRFGRVVVHRSRFECDLNRPRHKAVYRGPEDAWGLTVWRGPLSGDVVGPSLEYYDTFYREVLSLIESMVAVHPRVVLLDLHSYNHRREGPTAPPASADTDPDYNIGTATMTDRLQWNDVVEAATRRLAGSDRCGSTPVVAENLRFGGGHLGRFLHTRFPRRVGVLSLEVKKFFMDEWTGEPDRTCLDTVTRVIGSLAEDLEKIIGR